MHVDGAVLWWLKHLWLKQLAVTQDEEHFTVYPIHEWRVASETDLDSKRAKKVCLWTTKFFVETANSRLLTQKTRPTWLTTNNNCILWYLTGVFKMCPLQQQLRQAQTADMWYVCNEQVYSLKSIVYAVHVPLFYLMTNRTVMPQFRWPSVCNDLALTREVAVIRPSKPLSGRK